MAVKRTIPNKDGVYFITFICVGWLNLIDITNSYDVIYKWFDHRRVPQGIRFNDKPCWRRPGGEEMEAYRLEFVNDAKYALCMNAASNIEVWGIIRDYFLKTEGADKQIPKATSIQLVKRYQADLLYLLSFAYPQLKQILLTKFQQGQASS
jgi:hypothetical protein